MLRLRSSAVAAVAAVLLFTTVFISCERARNNPLDPGGSTYQPPSAEITLGPAEGQTVTSNSVEFRWSGNSDANLYRYVLTNYSDSSDWSASDSTNFNLLDDTTYTFTLQTKYPGESSIATYTRHFAVKSIHGPSLKFYRLKNTVALHGQFALQVWIVGISNFFSAQMKLTFDKSLLNLVSISGGSLVSRSGYSQAVLPDFSSATVIQAANSSGLIDVSTAVLSQNGTSGETIGGTGEVLRLVFSAIRAGRSSVNVSQGEVRDSTNTPVTLLSSSPSDSVIVSP